ncbi:MAG: hypothetical protein WC506_05550 [Candidatus Micrarchaeia archaeon]
MQTKISSSQQASQQRVTGKAFSKIQALASRLGEIENYPVADFKLYRQLVANVRIEADTCNARLNIGSSSGRSRVEKVVKKSSPYGQAASKALASVSIKMLGHVAKVATFVFGIYALAQQTAKPAIGFAVSLGIALYSHLAAKLKMEKIHEIAKENPESNLLNLLLEREERAVAIFKPSKK